MSTAPMTPFDDPAKPILENDPAINDDQRAQLWDVFHSSKSADELAQHMQNLKGPDAAPIVVPDDTKKRLYQAKQVAAPVDPIAKTKDIMQQLASIDPQVLEAAESHPNVLKTLTAAAGIGAKPAGEPAGSTKTAGKEKTPDTAQPLAQPPRIDGQPHLPPIPDGHHRVLASDGSLHDIPAENIEKARALDPRLHVLNP